MSEWINSYKNLPGYEQKVIVHLTSADDELVTIAFIDECFGWHYEQGAPLRNYRVLNWMPLPSPPQENK